MGYKDSFFKVENIIGYTGKLSNNPTVCFSREADMGIEFARITQAHEESDNVGRGKVRVRHDYKVYNVTEEKKVLGLFTKTSTHAYEYYDGDVQNYSRNELISREDFKPNDISILAQSIVKFTTAKPKYL